jgi:diguanylate cyclase (GGDEF)-like protein
MRGHPDPSALSGAVPGATRPHDAGDSPRESRPVPDGDLAAVLNATRALLWITNAAEAAAVAVDLVGDLGGTTVLAGTSNADALPVDVSFGVGEPLLPAAPTASAPRLLLERHLPTFVSDAHRILELVDRTFRVAQDAALDFLTGLPNRQMLSRALGRIQPEDTVIMIDLDHFKAVNDRLGHGEGDRVLRALGRSLTAMVRATERVGRYGGEEFVVILATEGADPFLNRLRAEWNRTCPHPVTFSAGVAPARPAPGRALEAADRAMYRAKQSGRDQWQWAVEADYR